MALIEGKRANYADMAMGFGLDPGAALGLSMGSSMTYDNTVSRFNMHRQDLMPWIAAVEQTIGALLPNGRDMRIDFSELTRPNPVQHYAAVQGLKQADLIDRDEGRAMLGLPPKGNSNGDLGAQPSGTEGLPPGDPGGLAVLPPGTAA
jgi:phage portal protein BeeE